MYILPYKVSQVGSQRLCFYFSPRRAPLLKISAQMSPLPWGPLQNSAIFLSTYQHVHLTFSLPVGCKLHDGTDLVCLLLYPASGETPGMQQHWTGGEPALPDADGISSARTEQKVKEEQIAVVHRYLSSLIRSATCEKCQNQRVPNNEAFSPVLWLIQILASSTSPEQVLSAETFFSCQNVMRTGSDKFWSQCVLRYD